VSEAHPIEQYSPAILPQQANFARADLDGTAPGGKFAFVKPEKGTQLAVET
jgi:hypothetical protein